MANTWPKLPLRVLAPTNSFLSLFERDFLEANSSTFPVGAPLKLASGRMAVFVNPADAAIAAFSLTAGQNGTDKTVKVVLATPEIEIEANFLGGSAADNVLAATDLGLTRDLLSDANLLGTGSAGWYISDAAADASVRICGFLSEHTLPNVLESFPAAGDTNARVRARVESGKSLWY